MVEHKVEREERGEEGGLGFPELRTLIYTQFFGDPKLNKHVWWGQRGGFWILDPHLGGTLDASCPGSGCK